MATFSEPAKLAFSEWCCVAFFQKGRRSPSFLSACWWHPAYPVARFGFLINTCLRASGALGWGHLVQDGSHAALLPRQVWKRSHGWGDGSSGSGSSGSPGRGSWSSPGFQPMSHESERCWALDGGEQGWKEGVSEGSGVASLEWLPNPTACRPEDAAIDRNSLRWRGCQLLSWKVAGSPIRPGGTVLLLQSTGACGEGSDS